MKPLQSGNEPNRSLLSSINQRSPSHQTPVLVWLCRIAFMLFILYQLSDFCKVSYRVRDEYAEKTKFVSTTSHYEVCKQYSFLSGICTNARIASEMGWVFPAIQEFLHGKILLTMVTFENWYVNVGICIIVVFAGYLIITQLMRDFERNSKLKFASEIRRLSSRT